MFNKDDVVWVKKNPYNYIGPGKIIKLPKTTLDLYHVVIPIVYNGRSLLILKPNELILQEE